MKRKSANSNFEKTLDNLRAGGFETAPWTGEPDAVLVCRAGAGAVLTVDSADGAIGFLVGPGAMVNGQLGRLVDRGYQKFIRAGRFELPATASQLHAIHGFQEELKQLAGLADLFNEGLGTTSDLYQYDRLKNRETAQPAPARPWDTSAGH